MAQRKQEEWGGEVRLPGWLRKALRRPQPMDDTPEAAHEARKAGPARTVAQNADRAAIGPLGDLYHEGRGKRQ